MGLPDGHQRRLELEQRVAALAAEQAELRRALRQRKLGPTDLRALKGELAAVQAELAQLRAALVATTREIGVQHGGST